MKIFVKLFIVFALFIVQNNGKAQCCKYRLSMHDSYGDGWNGATMQVFVNNISVGIFSGQNFNSIDSFTVCNGDSVKLEYTAGNYENENSYQLYNPNYTLIFEDGPVPATGLVDTSIGNCTTLLLAGNHPCTAIGIDTGQCITTNNIGNFDSGMDALCASFSGGDVWFAIVVPPSGNITVSTDSGTINDTGLGLWVGTDCSNLKLLACDDDGGVGSFSNASIYNQTPGEIIYIQVYGYSTAVGTFQLCVKDLGTVSLDSTELPIVIINSLNQTINSNQKINGLMQIKDKGLNNINKISDPANIYNGNIGIEIRGATSAGYPQKPYGIETRTALGANNNVSILGMPSENDWVLLSNFNDRSLIRNTLACKLFGDMGNYSVHTNLCEVIIDSAYKGIYVFGEKIKRSNNRVPISKLTATDTAGDNLTGGYILGQNYWDANNSFESNFSPIDHPGFDVHFLYEYPKPDSMPLVQKKYIASFVDSLETALYSTTFTDSAIGYRKFMDTKSFIDYFLINELSRNADGFKKSVFFNKEKNSKGGKLKAGPVWDFDWAWKNIYGCVNFDRTDGSGWAHKVNDCFTDNYSTGWYIRLLQDSNFKNELKCTYEKYRSTIFDTTYIFQYIDSMHNRVKNAQARHFKKWPTLGVSGPAPEVFAVATTYSAELDTLKQWITMRLKWLDANIPGYCAPIVVVPNSITNGSKNNAIQFYPNPSSGVVHFVGEQKIGDAVLTIYNVLGKKITEKKLKKGLVNFDYLFATKGFYYFTINHLNTIIQTGKIVIE